MQVYNAIGLYNKIKQLIIYTKNIIDKTTYNLDFYIKINRDLWLNIFSVIFALLLQMSLFLLFQCGWTIRICSSNHLYSLSKFHIKELNLLSWLELMLLILIFSWAALHSITIPLSVVGLKAIKALYPLTIAPLCHTISWLKFVYI
jgi:hypothetical protein